MLYCLPTAKLLLAQGNLHLRAQILENHFQQPSSNEQQKRAFIEHASKRNLLTTIPGALIYVYQNIISAQIQAECSYAITCSEYIKLCIEQYGFLKGTFAGLNQYMKCAGNNHKNHLTYMINEDGKIMNSISDEE
jgi:putative component of membrane protein insertase Oxa1/YidC/SpoIIIJ protein YidD